MTDLLALAGRCELSAGPDPDLDHAIWDVVGDNDGAPNFTASLDAAVTLVPEGMLWGVAKMVGRWTGSAAVHAIQPFRTVAGPIRAATPALALCAAALRARSTIVSDELTTSTRDEVRANNAPSRNS